MSHVRCGLCRDSPLRWPAWALLLMVLAESSGATIAAGRTRRHLPGDLCLQSQQVSMHFISSDDCHVQLWPNHRAAESGAPSPPLITISGLSRFCLAGRGVSEGELREAAQQLGIPQQAPRQASQTLCIPLGTGNSPPTKAVLSVGRMLFPRLSQILLLNSHLWTLLDPGRL